MSNPSHPVKFANKNSLYCPQIHFNDLKNVGAANPLTNRLLTVLVKLF
jgi:hypothetical protein